MLNRVINAIEIQIELTTKYIHHQIEFIIRMKYTFRK